MKNLVKRVSEPTYEVTLTQEHLNLFSSMLGFLSSESYIALGVEGLYGDLLKYQTKGFRVEHNKSGSITIVKE